MFRVIPFTIEHDQLLRGTDNRVGTLEKRFDALEKKVDALEKKVDSIDTRLCTLEKKVDDGFARMDKTFQSIDERFVRLEKRMEEGFREAKVLHEDLRAMFNRVVDFVMHINSKIESIEKIAARMDHFEVRLSAVESLVLKNA